MVLKIAFAKLRQKDGKSHVIAITPAPVPFYWSTAMQHYCLAAEIGKSALGISSQIYPWCHLLKYKDLKIKHATVFKMIFDDKVVLVTGAASGVGAATAIQFSEKGAKVALVDKNEVKLKDVAAQCTDSLVLHADVSNEDDVQRIIEETIKRYGKLDVLINNAGIIRIGSILDGTYQTYEEIMNVNFRAVVQLTCLAAPHLIKTKGNIVNISSVAARLPTCSPMSLIYNVSKAAVSSFTVCAASELGPHGVRVNAVSPGPINTDLLTNSQIPGDLRDQTKNTVSNRISEPDEIADLVLYLASDKAKGITGSNILSDNGFLMKLSM